LHRRVRPQGRQQGGVQRCLCGARGVAGPLRAPAGLRRGHVPPRPLRPHRHRRRRGRERKVSNTLMWRAFTSPRLRGEVDARSTAGEGDSRYTESAESWRPRAARRLQKTLLIAALALTSFVVLTAAWVFSLGPTPMGEALGFSTVVVDRNGQLLRPYAT